MSNNNKALEVVFSTNDNQLLSATAFLDELAEEINSLILTNFERLVQLLYRIDVSEMKLKSLLKENPNEDAGKIIAALIIERQIQKIKLRQAQASSEDDKSDEEKW